MADEIKIKAPSVEQNININVTGEEEIRRLYTELQAAQGIIDRLNSALQDTQTELGRVQSQYDNFAHGNGMDILREELARFRDTAEQSVYEFRAFLETVNLNDVYGNNDRQFEDLFRRIRDGSMTASQAIMRVKTDFRALMEESYANSNGLFDAQTVQGFNASLEHLGDTMSTVIAKLDNIEQNGVKSIGSAGGGSVTNVLEQIEAVAHGMSDEVKGAYESITSLVNAMNSYANIDSTKLLGISQAFRNIADIGQGRFGKKSIDNIIHLTTQLQALNANGGSIRFDFTGLNDLKVRKASVSNLATYLPQIAAVNVSNLERLSQVNLTNFNNVKVSKSAIENIARLTEAIQVLRETRAASVNVGDDSIDIGDLNGGTASSASSAAASMADLAAKTSEAASATAAKADTTKTDNAEELKRQSLLKKSYSLLTQMQNAERKWTAAKNGKSASSYTAIQKDIVELQRQILQFNSSHQITPDQLDQFSSALSTFSSRFTINSNAIKAADEATRTWGERLGSLSAKFGTWFSITRVLMAAVRAARLMVTNVIELDTAMTELKKVTDETDATYDRFLVRATSRAKELGAALSDTVNATADFARLGYGIEDAEKLADAAIVYKNVGDGIDDINTASESIIATMQAFDIQPERVMAIVDRFNAVGNNFAISSKGVGDALLRSAAALHSANNTLDESIALAAAANTVVQDPEKVGTTLRTISMFLRAAKTDAEDAGESTEGMASSISELRNEILALTGNKVDIQIDED